VTAVTVTRCSGTAAPSSPHTVARDLARHYASQLRAGSSVGGDSLRARRARQAMARLPADMAPVCRGLPDELTPAIASPPGPPSPVLVLRC
jgi:hypothetical protein